MSKVLVATGASASVFPHGPGSPSVPGVVIQLRTADGTSLDTNGSCCLALQFGSRMFEWDFLLAKVSMPILGSDFLHHYHHNLIVDLTGSCLLDASTLEPIPAIFSTPNSKSQLYTALLSTPEEFFDLIAEYPDAVSSKGFSSTVSKHPARHNVPTVPGPPVLAEKLESARKEFAAY